MVPTESTRSNHILEQNVLDETHMAEYIAIMFSARNAESPKDLLFLVIAKLPS